jgi:hypothetical protein
MTDYALVLTDDYPGRQWQINANDYDTLTFFDDEPVPTKAELDAKWPAVKHARAIHDVEAARRARYQAETDGIFFAAQRDGGDLTAWKAAVDQIKADLPYPEEPK